MINGKVLIFNVGNTVVLPIVKTIYISFKLMRDKIFETLIFVNGRDLIKYILQNPNRMRIF